MNTPGVSAPLVGESTPKMQPDSAAWHLGRLERPNPQAWLIEVKRAMAEDLRCSPLSRHEIADALGVTESRVSDWVAGSKLDHRIPVEFVGAWAMLLGSDRLPQVIDRAAGRARVVEFGKTVVEWKRLGRRVEEQAEALAKAA